MEDDEKKPLSTWQQIKIGVKSFFKKAANYVPHGLIMAPIGVGMAMLIANITGLELLAPLANLDAGGFIQKSLLGLALGSLFAGGIGAYQGISAANKQRSAEIAQQQGRARAPEREAGQQKEMEGACEVVSHGLSHDVKTTIQPGIAQPYII